MLRIYAFFLVKQHMKVHKDVFSVMLMVRESGIQMSNIDILMLAVVITV
jgi:hypothetical protein